ncbi:MAG TPA: protein phosphatase 2C domain-containing protein [Ktedonobacteraceae bacterium]|nr:protein phosphatase 2C domain-containing protein [Ktedonobacteraceae bacterium]
MLNRFNASYAAHRRVRRVSGVALGVSAVLLAMLTGGFPPWAWRLFFHTLPQFSQLWAQRGLGVVVPFIGLGLLSLTLFIIWGALLLAAGWMALHWWRAREGQASLEEGKIEPAYNVASQEDGLYDIARPASRPRGMADVLLEPAIPPYARNAVAQSGRQQAPAMPRTARNVRYDVPLGNGYRGVPTAPVAVADARHSSNGRSSVYLDTGTALDAGIKRRGRPNEDSLLALPAISNACGGVQPVGLFVIADGMGGHGNGQEASRLAISALHDALKLALVGSPEDDNYEQVLAEGAHTANLAVYRRNRQQQSDMGTTLAVALVIGNMAYIANVGDSRVYLYRESEGLEQITRDHSSVARLVEAGAITRDEAYSHPKRNEIYRSLGHQSTVKVDTFSVPLQLGDLLLLCSDGLWEMARDSAIEGIMESTLPDVSHTCDELRQAALKGGGKDNISIIAVCVRGAR